MGMNLRRFFAKAANGSYDGKLLGIMQLRKLCTSAKGGCEVIIHSLGPCPLARPLLS